VYYENKNGILQNQELGHPDNWVVYDKQHDYVGYNNNAIGILHQPGMESHAYTGSISW
jgi:hypothetical protein